MPLVLAFPRDAGRDEKGNLLFFLGLSVALCLAGILFFFPRSGGCEPARKEGARALLMEAKVSLHRNQLDVAESLLRRSIDLFEREVNSDQSSEATLASLLVKKERRLSYANALVALASVLEQKEEYQEAEGLLRKAFDILLALSTPPLDPMTSILDRLALVLEKEGRLAEADEVSLQVLANLKHMEEGEDSRATLVHKRRERVLQKAGVFEEQLREAVRKYEQAFGPDHVFVGRGLYHLALLMEEKGHDREAEALYKRTLKIHEDFLGPEHPAIANLLVHLAQLLRNRGDFDEAKIYLKKSLAIFENSLRETEPDRLEALKNMVLRARLDEDTTPYLQSIIEMERRNFGPDHPNVARSLRYLATYMESQGNYADAVKTLQQALRIFEDNLGHDHPERIITMTKLAGLSDVMGKHDEAVRLTREVLEIQEKKYGKNHPDTAMTVYNLALYHARNGDPDLSGEYLRRALKLYETSHGPEDMFVASILDQLAENCMERGRPEEAELLMNRSDAIRKKAVPPPVNPDAKPCPLRKSELSGPLTGASSGGRGRTLQ